MRVIILMMSLAICLVVIANADNGTASYYGLPYIPSACYGYKRHGINVAAASKALWNNRKACGQVYSVKCIGHIHAKNNNIKTPKPCKNSNETIIEIVDYCPKSSATINLSQHAFSEIADLKAGIIKIENSLFVADHSPSPSPSPIP